MCSFERELVDKLYNDDVVLVVLVLDVVVVVVVFNLPFSFLFLFRHLASCLKSDLGHSFFSFCIPQTEKKEK